MAASKTVVELVALLLGFAWGCSGVRECASFFVRRLVGGEDAGEEAGGEGFEGGEAGADDANVDFERAPHGGLAIVVGRVVAVGEGVDGD